MSLGTTALAGLTRRLFIGTMELDAFISYSHQADAKLAANLERGLKRFARPFHRLRPALQVFRDETSLSATPSLWSSIESRLLKARYLILLASPEAAQSFWVNKEMRTWLAGRPKDRLLIGLTKGELVWDKEAGRFDLERSNALPPELAAAFEQEPLYVDLRWARADGQALSYVNSRMQDAVATLAAPIHGRQKNELFGEEVREKRRALRLAWSVSALLLGLAVAIGVAAYVAVYQRDMAISRALAAQASGELSVDTERGVLLALNALDVKETREAQTVLRRLLLEPLPRLSFSGMGALSFDADGKLVLALHEDGMAQLWRLGDAVHLARFALPEQLRDLGVPFNAGCGTMDKPGRVDFAPSSDGSWIAFLDGDERVSILDLATGELVAEALEEGDERFRIRRLRRARAVRVSDLRGSQAHARISRGPAPRHLVADSARAWVQPHHSGYVFEIVLSGDGKSALAVSEDATATLWDISGRALKRTLIGHDGRVCKGAFSADGSMVVTASLDGTARAWDVRYGARLAVMRADRGEVTDAYFSRDDRWIVTHHLDGRRIDIWPVDWQPRLVLQAPGGGIFDSVRFSSDGRSLITGSDEGYRRWDARTGRPQGEMPAQAEQPSSVAGTPPSECPGSPIASPDGSVLASLSERRIHLCDAGSGAYLRRIDATDDAPVSVTFSPDGQFLLAAMESKQGSAAQIHAAAVFEVATGHLWKRWTGHENWLTDAAFSPSGDSIATASLDHTARVYEVLAFGPLDRVRALARTRVQRRLTPDERVLFGLAP